MSRPILGVLADAEPASYIAPFLRALTWWCDPCAASRAHPGAAWLATSPRAPGLSYRLGRVDAPGAVVIGPGDDATGLSERGATLVVVTTGSQSPGTVALPLPGLDGTEYPPMYSSTRRRWQNRLGLSDPHVLAATAEDARADSASPSALGTCSVAIVSGDLTLVAMALAAPTVTDRTTADRLRLAHGVDVLVADDDPGAVALELALDHEASAVMGRRARDTFVARHDISKAARTLAHRLALVDASEPANIVRSHLAELGVSPRSRPAQRIVNRSIPAEEALGDPIITPPRQS